MIPILDPKFKYVNATSTDIRRTIARERKRLAEEAAKAEQANRPATVTKIKAAK